MATRLVIDNFEFMGFEVPDSISFGGSQSLAIHKLAGGTRIIDAMGCDDAPLEWEGIFTGQNALSRAKLLDGYRSEGKMRKLTWGTFSYNVVIREFKAKYERGFHIPYKITCEVVEDLTKPIASAVASADIDSSIFDKINGAVSVADNLVESLKSDVASAIKQVKTAVQQMQAVYATVTQGIASFVNLETALIAVLNDAINSTLVFATGCQALIESSVGELAGLITDSSDTAVLLNEWAIDSTNLHFLNQLTEALVIASRNLEYINGSPNAKQITVAGGSLESLALEYYGDATEWPKIAEANNLSDPVIAGIHTITIPPAKTTTSTVAGGADVDHWVGDDLGLSNSNGIGSVNSITKGQQRILRRILTNPGDYKWHPNYGAGVLKYVGQANGKLDEIKGLIISQAQLEKGVAQLPSPTVEFTVSGDYVTANVEYTDLDSGSRQFLSFTVSR